MMNSFSDRRSVIYSFIGNIFFHFTDVNLVQIISNYTRNERKFYQDYFHLLVSHTRNLKNISENFINLLRFLLHKKVG